MSQRRKKQYQLRHLYWEAEYKYGSINAKQLQSAYAAVHGSLRIPQAEHDDVKTYAYIRLYWCEIVMGVNHSSDNRVLRGGAWINNGRNSRSVMRNNNTGFRLARELNMPEYEMLEKHK